MSATLSFTSADLALLPDDGKRYEIIEGELYVSRQPSAEHQYTCSRFNYFLEGWNDKEMQGLVLQAPGLIFAEDDDVAPDVIWISRQRYDQGRDEAGHLHLAPELVIEVLSPGKSNEDRDRQTKLKLYSRRGVQEYWIASWIEQFVEVYRREAGQLHQVATLFREDELDSPLLPGFSCKVAKLFLGALE
jgi:Uma2 family endonuclease